MNDQVDKAIEEAVSKPDNATTVRFKYKIGQEVQSVLHKKNGIIQYREYTEFINANQIQYAVMFEDPQDKLVAEEWIRPGHNPDFD